MLAINVGVACGLPVYAEALVDPTQPPLPLRQGTEGTAPGTPSEPLLQSILLSPSRKVAIISGQQVRVGEKFGEFDLVKISETEVVLKRGSDLRTLKLFPNVEKQRATTHNRAKPINQR